MEESVSVGFLPRKRIWIQNALIVCVNGRFLGWIKKVKVIKEEKKGKKKKEERRVVKKSIHQGLKKYSKCWTEGKREREAKEEMMEIRRKIREKKNSEKKNKLNLYTVNG